MAFNVEITKAVRFLPVSNHLVFLDIILGVPLDLSFGRTRVACCVGSVSPTRRDSRRIADAPSPLHPLTRWEKPVPLGAGWYKYYFFFLRTALLRIQRIFEAISTGSI